MKPVSLADISYEQGLKLLFLRKQALDEGVVQQLPPAALANSFIMNSTGTQVIKQAAGIEDFIPTDPNVLNLIRYGLGGAGLGALGAGGLAALRKEKNWKRRLLQGATAGGLLGGGLGVALNPSVITDSIAPAVAGLTEKGMQTGKPTPETQRQDYVDELKSRSNANPLFGAVIPTGTGIAASFGLNKALKKFVPGMQGLDRRYIAQEWLSQFMDDPSKVNAKKIDIKDALGNNALDKFTTRTMPFGSKAPANYTEANRQNMVKQISKKIPLSVVPDEAGLSDYFKDEKTLSRVAANSTNKGLLSRASGSIRERLLKGNLGRRGLTAIPAIVGGVMGLNQVDKDMKAVAQAKQQLKNIERGITDEMLYGVPRENAPLPKRINKDPSNINNASLIASLLQKGLGLSVPTRGDYR